MKLARRTFAVISILLLTISAFGYFFWYKPMADRHSKKISFAVSENTRKDNRETMLRLYQRSVQARHYIKAHGFNSRHCFLMDMRLPSGSNRFFVYNTKKESIVYSGLVAHGCCNESFIANPRFSNASGSGCSSLGKYKVGEFYRGQWGKSFRLYGLDKSNSNAYKRAVVIHGHSCIEDKEIYPRVLCNSFGCPMVSFKFFDKLSGIIEKSDKPILLWIYR